MGRYIIVSANKSTPTAVAECLAGRLIVQFVSLQLAKVHVVSTSTVGKLRDESRYLSLAT